MYTIKVANHNLDMYEWQPIERFVMEFDFALSGHEKIIELGERNLEDLNKKLDEEVEMILKDLEKTHPNDEEYANHIIGDYGTYESIIIHNYSEILWKSTITYQVNQIEAHLKALFLVCTEYFAPSTNPRIPNQKIISTYHDYLIKTCEIKSVILDQFGPKMIAYYKVRNCIVHDNSIPDNEVKRIIMDYKEIGFKKRASYIPSINELLNRNYCLEMLNDIKVYFKELYICIDNMYASKEKALREVESGV
jgi:hypothetical protein